MHGAEVRVRGVRFACASLPCHRVDANDRLPVRPSAAGRGPASTRAAPASRSRAKRGASRPRRLPTRPAVPPGPGRRASHAGPPAGPVGAASVHHQRVALPSVSDQDARTICQAHVAQSRHALDVAQDCVRHIAIAAGSAITNRSHPAQEVVIPRLEDEDGGLRNLSVMLVLSEHACRCDRTAADPSHDRPCRVRSLRHHAGERMADRPLRPGSAEIRRAVASTVSRLRDRP